MKNHRGRMVRDNKPSVIRRNAAIAEELKHPQRRSLPGGLPKSREVPIKEILQIGKRFGYAGSVPAWQK